ncbi:MAG: hypothetical protein ACRDY7_03780, partial [Acidimicrobiia bacterium]
MSGEPPEPEVTNSHVPFPPTFMNAVHSDRDGVARLPNRRGFTRAMAMMVAALMAANGAILTENATGVDLEDFFRDRVHDARAALSDMLDPGEEEASGTAGGLVDQSTTTTGAGGVPSTPGDPSTSTTIGDPASPGGPGTPSTSAPGSKGQGGRNQPRNRVTPGSSPPLTPGTGAPGTTAPPGTAPGSGGVATPASDPTEAALAPLRAYVERERGLTFTSPVRVVKLADGPFKSRLASARLDGVVERARRAQGALQALGVIGADVDLVAQIKRLSTGSAPAFYDRAANELVVRGDLNAPFTRKILVHELTHALNDQHFELHRPALSASGDESAQSFEALADGIASHVEGRYLAGMSEADRQAVAAEQSRLAGEFPRDVPQYVLVSFGFPFTAGKRLAATLYEVGGSAALDRALQRPPTTTEQVLRPEKYAAGEGPAALAAPPADGPQTGSGSFGQLTLA